MTDKKSDESRRKLLKSIAAGSGAIVAGKSLPDSWSKPVVDSVLLPVHAQTSFLCSAGSIDSVDDDNEGVVILFDGVSNCSLITVSGPDGGDSGNPDEMLLIDNDHVDSGTENFDIDGPAFGANWSNDGPDLVDQTAGPYSFVRTRLTGPNAGVDFRVAFTVSFSGSDTMTVSNVVITLA
jgi:hypothetical protein